MAVKIRLQRKGRKKRPFYHIVVADARAPRDGRFIEKLGTYNPMTSPATIDLDRDAAFEWLMKGAQPTDTARAILRFKGVLYKKHLNRGIQKGALTQEQADAKYQAWIDEKDAKIASRVAKGAEDKIARLAALSGTPPPPPAPPAPEPEPVVEEAAPAVEAVAEETAEVVVEEAAPAEEATEEVVVEKVVENVGDEDPELAALNEKAADDAAE